MSCIDVFCTNTCILPQGGKGICRTRFDPNATKVSHGLAIIITHVTFIMTDVAVGGVVVDGGFIDDETLVTTDVAVGGVVVDGGFIDNESDIITIVTTDVAVGDVVVDGGFIDDESAVITAIVVHVFIVAVVGTKATVCYVGNKFMFF